MLRTGAGAAVTAKSWAGTFVELVVRLAQANDGKSKSPSPAPSNSGALLLSRRMADVLMLCLQTGRKLVLVCARVGKCRCCQVHTEL